MRDYIVQHLPTIDILEEHIPVISCAHYISHRTYVWVIQECDNRRLSCRSNLLRMISPLPICLALMVVVLGRASWYDLNSNLGIIVSFLTTLQSMMAGYLLSPFNSPRKLHLAHTPGPNRLAQNPIACLGRNRCS